MVRRDLTEERAVEAVSALRRATIVPGRRNACARGGRRVSGRMASPWRTALVYATARRYGATLVTGDADFHGLPEHRSSFGEPLSAVERDRHAGALRAGARPATSPPTPMP